MPPGVHAALIAAAFPQRSKRQRRMALRIRLARGGAKKRPFYRIVAADSRSPRDGHFLERLGSYNPLLPSEEREPRSCSTRSASATGWARVPRSATASHGSSTRPASCRAPSRHRGTGKRAAEIAAKKAEAERRPEPERGDGGRPSTRVVCVARSAPPHGVRGALRAALLHRGAGERRRLRPGVRQGGQQLFALRDRRCSKGGVIAQAQGIAEPRAGRGVARPEPLRAAARGCRPPTRMSSTTRTWWAWRRATGRAPLGKVTAVPITAPATSSRSSTRTAQRAGAVHPSGGAGDRPRGAAS